MTLRDLTKRQLYNLTRRMEKLKKEYLASYHEQTPDKGFMVGFDRGVKEALKLFPVKQPQEQDQT